MFYPSAQCTEDANKARRLTFMIRRSFQDLPKSDFIPLYGAVVRLHLEYGMLACSPNLVADINHLERIQRLATKLVTGMRHLPYEERLQRLGLHSLQWRRLRDELIAAFKILKSLLNIDLKLIFLPPARRNRRVVKYWNKLPASVITAPSANVFKKRLEEVWTEVFPHLYPLTEHSLTPFHLPPSHFLLSKPQFILFYLNQILLTFQNNIYIKFENNAHFELLSMSFLYHNGMQNIIMVESITQVFQKCFCLFNSYSKAISK